MNNTVFNNFIINSSIELKPMLRISPFNEEYMGIPSNSLHQAEQYLNTRFQKYILTTKGREAIDLALSYYKLKKDDVVTILTSSNNFYISSCVTKVIEKHCLWSRKISNKTKVIFINHEFGYPYPNLSAIKKYNLPIIEDCAQSFMSNDKDETIGNIGDFVVYSLPKFFPMQIGGILKINKRNIDIPSQLDSLHKHYIFSHLSEYISSINKICQKRLANYNYLKDNLSSLGIEPFFRYTQGIVPGVFLFKWHSNINYPLLKEFMQTNGVESSVFYGQNAFFVPVHHNLSNLHLDYIISLIKYFYNDLL